MQCMSRDVRFWGRKELVDEINMRNVMTSPRTKRKKPQFPSLLFSKCSENSPKKFVGIGEMDLCKGRDRLGEAPAEFIFGDTGETASPPDIRGTTSASPGLSEFSRICAALGFPVSWATSIYLSGS